MEELKIRYEQLLRVYKRLAYMRNRFVVLSQEYAGHHDDVSNEENELITHRDALIQRFEISYDLTWKFFKLMLKTLYAIDANSPRKAFQESYEQGLITEEESNLLITMMDARNATSHIYDETMADRISRQIADSHALLSGIVVRLSEHVYCPGQKKLI